MISLLNSALILSTHVPMSITPDLYTGLECNDRKKTYEGGKCCGPGGTGTPGLWPEEIAFNNYMLSLGLQSVGTATPEQRATFGASYGAPDRETVITSMGEKGYAVEYVTSEDNFQLPIFIKDAHLCEKGVFLNYYAFGLTIGSPALVEAPYGHLNEVAKNKMCIVLPYYRQAFDNSTHMYIQETPNPNLWRMDGVAAMVYSYAKMSTDSVFVVVGSSAGSFVALHTLKKLNDEGKMVRKPDVLWMVAPEMDCTSISKFSMLRQKHSTPYLAWSVADETQTLSYMTDPETMCPNLYPESDWAAFAKQYVITIGRHDGFFDHTVELFLRLVRANIRVEFYVNPNPINHIGVADVFGRNRTKYYDHDETGSTDVGMHIMPYRIDRLLEFSGRMLLGPEWGVDRVY